MGRLFSCAKPLCAPVAAQGIGSVSVLSGKFGRAMHLNSIISAPFGYFFL